MDILKLLERFESMIDFIEETVLGLEKNMHTGLSEMPGLLAEIEKILPDWFFFIEQTNVGSKEMILDILGDITNAMQVSDEVLLTDALLYGLQSLLLEYCNIIKEALYEE